MTTQSSCVEIVLPKSERETYESLCLNYQQPLPAERNIPEMGFWSQSERDRFSDLECRWPEYHCQIPEQGLTSLDAAFFPQINNRFQTSSESLFFEQLFGD